ncbi:MAG: Asp-tRNA(Asn)/Glu-tRNA(Gln) amidotransferase subunit GatA [Persicimonas sp.]
MSPPAWTISELVAAFKRGETTSEEVLCDTLEAIESHEDLNCYVNVRDREALREVARRIDLAREEGNNLGPLAGVPVAVKDNICTRVLPTTAASRMLADFEPPYVATVVERLRAADAIVVGKTNLDEFAMGSSNETSFFGPVANPHDTERVPGGSSGGSAAAVATGQCVAALGSDTGGSIRQPASHCGVVGAKPTWGRVSRYGLIAFASSLDQVGPLARTVEDAARLLEVISGPDPRDATCADREPPDLLGALDVGVEGLTLGVPADFFEVEGGVDREVRARVDEAVERLEAAGADVVEVSLPHTEYAVATYYLIATAEASSNLARYDGARYGHRAEADNLVEMYEKTRAEGFGDEVKRRIMLGTYVLSAGYYDRYFRKAQKVRTLIKRDFEEAFERVDALIAPTAPTAAFELGQKTRDPLEMYLEDVFTISCNLAGIPGMSVPCGETDEGLPVGLQIMAPAFDEETMLRVGAAVEDH